VADFFRGKTITIAVGFPAGGGYDIYGRLAARYLGKYVPGNPNVIAQNMIGAGGLKAANYIYSVAPKDGTALGVIPDSSVSEELPHGVEHRKGVEARVARQEARKAHHPMGCAATPGTAGPADHDRIGQVRGGSAGSRALCEFDRHRQGARRAAGPAGRSRACP